VPGGTLPGGSIRCLVAPCLAAEGAALCIWWSCFGVMSCVVLFSARWCLELSVAFASMCRMSPSYSWWMARGALVCTRLVGHMRCAHVYVAWWGYHAPGGACMYARVLWMVDVGSCARVLVWWRYLGKVRLASWQCFSSDDTMPGSGALCPYGTLPWAVGGVARAGACVVGILCHMLPGGSI
jgi:hypothetical protein